MTWNYRVVKRSDADVFGIHEVYYNDDGSPGSMTKDPVTFEGDTAEEVTEQLEMALKDARKYPVFMEKDLPGRSREKQYNSKLTVSDIVKALREGFTHGYVTSEIGDRRSVRFSVLVSIRGGEYLFHEDLQLADILVGKLGVDDFAGPILDRWHRYMTLSKEELEKADGALYVPLLGPSLAETADG